MLFNSYEFVLGFLPITLLVFYLLGRFSRDAALAWIIAASLFFYAWWRPVNVALIAPSIALNYALAHLLSRWREAAPRRAMALLVLGLAFNLCFLGYFKYLNFFRESLNAALGTNLILTSVILPLGISFITFQKIAFLVDVNAGRVKSFTLRDYCLFVLFFPQLIAGPIVHYREMMPQFAAARCRFDGENFAVGLTLFFFGLFKKLVLADAIAPLIAPVFALAAAGEPVSLFHAWIAALGFTLQLYFDFSGYTDMALGLARFFGIRLPMNFDSPLRATSIIDFWQRWHNTLTRFLTAYLFNPIAMARARKRAARGRSVITARSTPPGAFISLVAYPTIMTMFLAGMWHGAGWTFVLFGLMHGSYIVINRAWRAIRPSIWPDTAGYTRKFRPAAWAITFIAVVASMVIFRAQTVASAWTILMGMAGLNGASLPLAVQDRLHAARPMLDALGIVADMSSGVVFTASVLWITALLGIVLSMPNTLQMLARFEPALGVKPRAEDGGMLGRFAPLWKPSRGWALAMSVIAAAGVLSLSKPTAFLYWQF